MILAPDMLKQSVMVHPHDKHCQKAGDIRQVRRPLMYQHRAELDRIQFILRRHMNVQRQQRNRNGKHAVTEGLNPSGIVIHPYLAATPFRI